MNVNYHRVSTLRQKAASALGQVQALNLMPDGTRKSQDIKLPVRMVEEITGKARGSLVLAEQKGIIPEREKNPLTNRKENFTLSQAVALQEHFNVRPTKKPSDPLVKIAVQNFKGGVGKSTTACSLAHYLSEKGYKVLLIDADPQGSTTATFGYLPDLDLKQDETMFPYFYGLFENKMPCTSIDYAIRKTNWVDLDLIPSNLLFGHAEYVIANLITVEGEQPFSILKNGIDEIQKEYDVVIIDSPPSLNFIAINILNAANAYIIPAPPGLYDFISTHSFLTMLEEIYNSNVVSDGAELMFMKILPTRVESNNVHKAILDVMLKSFGEDMIRSVVPSSKYIREASNMMTTIYEMPNLESASVDKGTKTKRVTSMKGYQSARRALDLVHRQIEELILDQRSSSVEDLLAEVK